MNDIVLLMTGVLITKQPFPFHLPKQPVIQLDNGVQKLTRNQLYQVVSSAKITPPEFARLNESFPATPLEPKPEYRNTLMNKTEKFIAKDLYSLAEFKHFQAVRLKFSDEQRLIAKQSREENVVKKPHQVNFSENKRFIAQEISEENFAAKSQRVNSTNLPNLRFNSSGLAVRVLQRLLVANGYAIRVDGVFGALTESAVKAFQNQHNLIVDGVVGQNTWYFLTK
ncbi:peptidoglycan-binding protein [Nostoc sp. CENA67]|uniref:Peptidoglycan-binding protein n=1 Tax=Amazonocrinis nigriterrae CENA67 TaxID=2794033 RepID=A0A8J7HTY5_9NOST|nr:peptidoglycan-binding domain-containing protein [Amazonocrinis nigriterrae]MBH8563270.1 peptidoglycan-binding protein [Amazonocrinis nigriterrae CENA67]